MLPMLRYIDNVFNVVLVDNASPMLTHTRSLNGFLMLSMYNSVNVFFLIMFAIERPCTSVNSGADIEMLPLYTVFDSNASNTSSTESLQFTMKSIFWRGRPRTDIGILFCLRTDKVWRKFAVSGDGCFIFN